MDRDHSDAAKSLSTRTPYAMELRAAVARILRAYTWHSPTWAVPRALINYLDCSYTVRPTAFVAETHMGFLVEGDTRDFIQRRLFLRGVWEPGLTAWLRRRLAPGDIFIDVGANIGYYTLLASRLVGNSGSVVSIEASPAIFQRLGVNVSMNAAENVRLVNRAVTDREGTVSVFLGPDSNVGASSVYAAATSETERRVRGSTLCDILLDDEVRRARVIKIDVEGAEDMVIRGLLPCLGATRADLELVVEVGGGPSSAPTAAESSASIVAALKTHGFKAYHLNAYLVPQPFLREHRRSPILRRLQTEHVDVESDLVFSRTSPDLP